MISSLILEVLDAEYKESKCFTCGEISAKVLTEFLKKTQGSAVEEEGMIEKERKTVKRRVYDSINVLIALGKIKKERKWLSVSGSGQKVGEEMIEVKRETLTGLNSSLTKKE